MITVRRGSLACTKVQWDRLHDQHVAIPSFDIFRLYTISSRRAEMMTPNAQSNVPGTEYLVDTNHNLDVSHAGSGESDIVLLPQPTACGRDPLVGLTDIID